MINSGIPKYLLIAQDIEKKIKTGFYLPNSFLPPEKEFGKIYKVSRTTIRATTAKLREAGMIKIVRGKGTQVRNKQIYQSLENYMTFTNVIRAQGYEPGTIVVESGYVQPMRKVSEKMKIKPGEKVFKIGRIRTADGEVVNYQLSYLRKEFSIDKKKIEEIKSLYKYLEETYDVFILYTEDTIYALSATPKYAKLLRVDVGAPLLILDRLAYDRDGRIIEVSNSWLRSDWIKYLIRIFRRGQS